MEVSDPDPAKLYGSDQIPIPNTVWSNDRDSTVLCVVLKRAAEALVFYLYCWLLPLLRIRSGMDPHLICLLEVTGN
jgi:hypothetical protein